MENLDKKVTSLGETVDLNNYILLDDIEYAWHITKGNINLFLVQLEKGIPVGLRTPIFTVSRGMTVFPVYSKNNGINFSLLATGDPDTQLVKIRFSDFTNIAGENQFTDAICADLNSWIEQISSCIFTKLHPREAEEIQPGAGILLEAGRVFKPQKETFWCEIIEGNATFLNDAKLGQIKQKLPFALSSKNWISAESAIRINAFTTKDFVLKTTFRESFINFNKIMFSFLLLRRNEYMMTERRHLETRRSFDTALLDSALHDISSPLLPESEINVFLETDSPLLSACKIIGRHSGISFVKPPDSGEESLQNKNSSEELEEICRTGRVKKRRVTLSENWWNEDCGPLLGFKSQDNSPVALIPVSSSEYEIYDTAQKTRHKVNRKIASLLSLSAFTFYRHLPERKLSVWDILKFTFSGAKGSLITVLIMGILGVLLNLLVPIATGIIFDTVIPNAELGLLTQLIVILTTCALGITVFDITESVAILRLQGKMDFSMQSALWDRLVSLPASFFRKYTAGDLAVRSLGITAIRQILSVVTVKSVLAAVFSLLNFFLLFYYSSRLAWICTAISIVTILIVIPFPLIILRFQQKAINLEGKLSGMVLQFITGISKLKVTGAEGRAFSVWAKEYGSKEALVKKAGICQNVLVAFYSILPLISLIFIFSVTFFSLFPKGNISPGNFMAFVSAFTNYQAAFMQMVMSLILGVNIIPLYRRIKPVLQELPESMSDKPSPGILTGRLDISHISFRYHADSPLILEDISLSASPGEFIAIAGSSGAGKSTLLRLLLGFETPDSGSIYYDGKDLSKIDVNEMRRQAGVVLQNGKIMQTTILDNIVGASGFTIKEAWEAAEMAGCKKDIEEMPMQMYTVITVGGGTLSGGQRQRILIARALVRKPRIIFFDEATSALDNETQAVVIKSLEGIKAMRIVIAHRLSTIVNADRIYVLDKGRIVQCGRYSELISKEGVFKRLAERQLV